MKDKRKLYLKKYRLEHKEKYREYQRKYRGTHLSTYEKLQQENQKYKEAIDKAIELLGNYRHYSIPDEKQNSDNEDLVNNAFDILKGSEINEI